MNVVMLSPGFPDDMPHFTRGLASVGARVLGVGDQAVDALQPEVREALADYLRVESLWDEQRLANDLRGWLRGRSIDRVECLWEPGMSVAATLRQVFGVPGLTPERTRPLRDKVAMKDVLARAGVRVPHHAGARTGHEVRAAAERIGFPLIVKPIAGAGAADTYRVDGPDDLDQVIGAIRHVPEVDVEEFITGDEHTFDTITIGGHVVYENVGWYRPPPLVARQNPWMSPQAVCIRDIAMPELDDGRKMGRKVIQTLGFETGITHMEWFRTATGEAVFGEIGGRAPGGRLTHAMNYASDIDLFRGWAEAVCHGRFTEPVDRRYNAAVVFKRAEGEGRIERIEGLQGLLARYGDNVAHIDLVPVGAPRRDWRQVVTGDGWVVVRHPELQTTLEIADAFGTKLRMFAA